MIFQLIIDKWKDDYDFRTMVNSLGSLAITAIFALYNGFIGLQNSSLWYGGICAYYIMLVNLRGLILIAEKKIARRGDREEIRKKVYIAASILLLVLNSTLIIPITIMVKQQKPFNLTLVPAIAMAVYSFYKLTMASVNLKKRKKSANSLVRLLRMINFIDALVSILTLQNTLIMLESTDDKISLLPVTASTSAGVLIAVLILSIAAIANGVMCIKEEQIE